MSIIKMAYAENKKYYRRIANCVDFAIASI
jgi:hypothetical protein